jgi:hypothetical protein
MILTPPSNHSIELIRTLISSNVVVDKTHWHHLFWYKKHSGPYNFPFFGVCWEFSSTHLAPHFNMHLMTLTFTSLCIDVIHFNQCVSSLLWWFCILYIHILYKLIILNFSHFKQNSCPILSQFVKGQMSYVSM